MTDDQSKLTPARRVNPRRGARSDEEVTQPRRRSRRRHDVADAGSTAEATNAAAEERDEYPNVGAPVQMSMPVTADAGAAAQTAPAATGESTPETEVRFDFPRTMRDTVDRVDQSWSAFRAAALRFPLERLNEPVGDGGWTRKQMLSHVAAWHDLTADRLVKLVNSGALPQRDGRTADQINAAVARQAVGKTAGEILKDIDTTFSRLRRQLERVSDAQLEANDWEVAYVIGGNTYGHYAEHWADVQQPAAIFGGRARR